MTTTTLEFQVKFGLACAIAQITNDQNKIVTNTFYTLLDKKSYRRSNEINEANGDHLSSWKLSLATPARFSYLIWYII